MLAKQKFEVLQSHSSQFEEDCNDQLGEIFTKLVIQDLNFMDLNESYLQIHQKESSTSVAKGSRGDTIKA